MGSTLPYDEPDWQIQAGSTTVLGMGIVTGLLLAQALITPGDSLTLAEALRLAREHRGVLPAAAAGVREARGARRVAGTIPNPVVSYTWSESPPKRQVTLDQPLGWLVRQSADRGTASARIDRALADSTQLAADLTREVRRAFYGTLAAGARVVALRAQALLADSLVTLGRRRVAAGDISPLELEQIVQEAARTAHTLSEAVEARAVAMILLARTLGISDTTRIAPAGNLADGLDSLPAVSPVPTRSLPRVQAAFADSAAAARAFAGARRGRIPFPSVHMGVEWDDPSVATQRSFLSFGVAIPFPLWNLGNGQVAAARGGADRAAALALETALDLERLAREQTVRVEHRWRRAHLARDSLLPSAARIRDGTVRQYAAGRATVLAVFDALRAEQDIILTVINDLLAFQEARADLDALLGRSD